MRLHIEQIVAGGQDDVAHIDLDESRLPARSRSSWARSGRRSGSFAFAPLEVDAVFGVDDRIFGHSLRERPIDHLALAQARLEHIINDR